MSSNPNCRANKNYRIVSADELMKQIDHLKKTYVPHTLKTSGRCLNCEKLDCRSRCSRCHHRFFCNAKCQSKIWWFHKRECHPVDLALLQDKRNQALIQAVNMNLFAEYHAMCYYIEQGRSDVVYKAECMIYGAVIEWILSEPVAGDLPDPEDRDQPDFKSRMDRFNAATKQIKDAAQMLVDSGNEHELARFSTSPFIPKSIHCQISSYWHGICHWTY